MPCARAQSTASQTSHSLNPFGVQRSRGIEESESAPPAGQTAKWRKPVGAPGRRPADDEEGVLVVEPEERVERHHEAALRLGAAPFARDLLELVAQPLVDRPRPQHLGAVAGAREPVDRLAHLPDRPALERERRRSRPRPRHRGRARAGRGAGRARGSAPRRRGSRSASPARGRSAMNARAAAERAAAAPIGSPETIATPPTTR